MESVVRAARTRSAELEESRLTWQTGQKGSVLLEKHSLQISRYVSFTKLLPKFPHSLYLRPSPVPSVVERFLSFSIILRRKGELDCGQTPPQPVSQLRRSHVLKSGLAAQCWVAVVGRQIHEPQLRKLPDQIFAQYLMSQVQKELVILAGFQLDGDAVQPRLLDELSHDLHRLRHHLPQEPTVEALHTDQGLGDVPPQWVRHKGIVEVHRLVVVEAAVFDTVDGEVDFVDVVS